MLAPGGRLCFTVPIVVGRMTRVAGFTHIAINQVGYPAATALTALTAWREHR
jgi:hypothetical protein